MTMTTRMGDDVACCHFRLRLLLLLAIVVFMIPAVVQASCWISPSSSSSSSSLFQVVKNNAGGTAVSTKKPTKKANSRVDVPPPRRLILSLSMISTTNDDDSKHDDEKEEILVATATTHRRLFLTNHIPAALLLGTTVLIAEPSYAAAVQAVGSAESACREAGNCLEIGQWDGAVGWNWGGKDRCDATDPKCGPDGKLRNGEIIGKPVPRPPLPPAAASDSDASASTAATNNVESSAITHVAILRIDVGREESGILRLGLYGRDAPGSVQQMMDFLSADGLSTSNDANNNNADDIGTFRVPVTLNRGGVVDLITPGIIIDFGVPSQSNAYARSRGTSKVPSGFVPQSRPNPNVVQNDITFIRSHDQAGLVSVSKKGLGYGGTGFESDDEAFESAFLITAYSGDDDVASSITKGLDKNRRVIGQVLDHQSMSFLERLSTLPTKRGIRGVIPGQRSGPPLIKVVVREATVAKVVSN